MTGYRLAYQLESFQSNRFIAFEWYFGACRGALRIGSERRQRLIEFGAERASLLFFCVLQDQPYGPGKFGLAECDGGSPSLSADLGEGADPLSDTWQHV